MENPTQQIRSEINVTPLVDVVLVLLIIFMVVTPMIVTHQVEIPDSRNPGRTTLQKQVSIYLTRDGDMFFEETPVIADNLVGRLQKLQTEDPQTQILLHADRRLSYARVSDCLDLISQAGFPQVALIAQPKEKL